MFGLPPGNPLREVVVELTRDHPRSVDGVVGTEPPLLRLLEVAIKADTSGASGGSGRSKNSAPLDVTALSLWEEIRTTVGNNWPGRGDLTYQNTLLIDRLTWWTNNVAGGENEHHLLEFCEYWRTSIRNLLEPPKRVPLRGAQCPACKETWFLKSEADPRETVYVPVLLAWASESPLRVECLACGENFNELALRLLVG
jgi:Zn ribbon nucleic-acid-binding protein